MFLKGDKLHCYSLNNVIVNFSGIGNLSILNQIDDEHIESYGIDIQSENNWILIYEQNFLVKVLDLDYKS